MSLMPASHIQSHTCTTCTHIHSHSNTTSALHIQGSEQETLIKAVGDMFLLNGKLDDGMQLWRYSPIQGPAMRKFEATCQVKQINLPGDI